MNLTGKVKSVENLRGGTRVVINLGSAGEIILNGMDKQMGNEYVAGNDVAIEMSTTPVAPPETEPSEPPTNESGSGDFSYGADAGE